MLNTITLIGRLTRDPELRYTQNGVAVTQFTLAVDRPFTDQNGNKKTDFIDIITWRGLAETCAEHLNKGRLVAVVGRLEIETYETQDGQRRRSARVVAEQVRFLDSKKNGDNNNDIDPASIGSEVSFDPDEIPF
ncbi:MAG: single-stranded DNA-binding protein [Syntrophothermus sp.]|uniref:single-stranded DNA-binding protein n=1 Tax=Syntrophothermus sp. TaxID=2736299 RepID=UPI00257DC657|nr:single-stranded DNA-binding protein [Syntrophothermus sp.]NSW83928.1 single-stranded DNA-binding protein [Syntrophothermus sp.]